jgi:hypothetical protein
MQFIGAKGMTLFVAIFLIACGAVFGAGLLVGRQFPAHHFERFGDSYLLDSATGKVCVLAAFDNPKDAANSSQHSDFADWANKRVAELNPSYPPPCEK